MVIFGGLELVAAGYIIHKHSKNKEEKRRLDEEAAILEEEEDRLRAERHARRRRRRSDEYDRRHEYSQERKDGRRPHREPQPAQYLDVNTPQPIRSHSAPPQEQYPPTGWPAHWEQSQRPQPNATPAQTKSSAYNYSPSRQPAQGANTGGRPSAMRPVSPVGRYDGRYSNEALAMQGTGQSGRNKHVRLVIPGEEVDRRDRYDPPPEYRE